MEGGQRTSSGDVSGGSGHVSTNHDRSAGTLNVDDINGSVEIKPRSGEMLYRPSSIIVTDIPGRLDRLPWSQFHTRVVVALGITWILDGLEVTLVGSLAGALRESPTLRFSAADVGFAGS